METDVTPASHYISVPNFMLVSKSAEFTRNFELCRRTTPKQVL